MITANRNAQPEVKNVLNWLYSVCGKRIVLGQHTQTLAQEELSYIEGVTGKLPALCGFELLGYSPNACRGECTEECLTEYNEACGTLEKAWEWAERGGLITLTWHWFSPIGGYDKSFFSRYTDFNAAKALCCETEEYRSLISDMDYMAGLLRPFCDKHIPILWRPFHECEGDWFWWGKQGHETAKMLYQLMFERYVGHYHLDNLIWVFNSPLKECYPGDEYVDILTRDMYPPEHKHITCEKEIAELRAIAGEGKLLAVGEIGTLPDVEGAVAAGVPMSYFMTWSKQYGGSDKYTSEDMLRKIYGSDGSVTLDRLPKLY